MTKTPLWMQQRGIEPKKTKRRVSGLGDVVAMVTEATGIAAVVHLLAGDDCGCERRRELLNGLMPFGTAAKKKSDESETASVP